MDIKYKVFILQENGNMIQSTKTVIGAIGIVTDDIFDEYDSEEDAIKDIIEKGKSYYDYTIVKIVRK